MCILDLELHEKLHEAIDRSLRVRHLAVEEVGSLTILAEPIGGQVDWTVFDNYDGEDLVVGRSYDFDFESCPVIFDSPNSL